MEETSSNLHFQNLRPCVTHLNFGEKHFFLIATAHISQQSINDVSSSISDLHPDSVCLELCWARYHAMLHDDNQTQYLPWKQIFFSKKVLYNIAQTILLFFYKKMGNKLKIKPGAEMHEAIKCSEKIGAYIIPADRDVEETLSKAWSVLTFFDKLSLGTRALWYMCGGYHLTREKVEEMKQPDKLDGILSEFSSQYPKLKECMIDERDSYLAENIFHAPGDIIVAVLGAGHIPGVTKKLESLEQQQQEL